MLYKNNRNLILNSLILSITEFNCLSGAAARASATATQESRVSLATTSFLKVPPTAISNQYYFLQINSKRLTFTISLSNIVHHLTFICNVCWHLMWIELSISWLFSPNSTTYYQFETFLEHIINYSLQTFPW